MNWAALDDCQPDHPTRALPLSYHPSAMPTTFSSEQIEQQYVESMGPELGRIFHRLFSEYVGLRANWHDYVILFGTNEDRVKLLNAAAPAWFRRVQDALWEDTLLHICRLTDPAKVGGKETLTVRRLPALVVPELRPALDERIRTVATQCQFARDWRNRHIGHRNLDLALENETATALADASRQGVDEAIDSIDSVLISVERHYCGAAPTCYDFAWSNSAELVVRVLQEGLAAREERRQRRRTIRRPPLANG